MKLQGLAVMFIIIILPISMVLASYTESRVETLRLQIEYDEKLRDATSDAVRAFQINSLSGDESILANYKMEDIQAAVNTFYNSLRSSFAMGGYNNRNIEEFVPALVFILYDGYYIYSPYQNTWDQETIDETNNYKVSGEETTFNGGNTTDANREKLFGLKPYIYYSCRYVKGNTDVVISYSLDNYITIKGVTSGKPVNISGYLLSDVSQDASGTIRYRGNVIETETGYTEKIVLDGQVVEASCRKINGTKYYSYNGQTFHYFNGEKVTDSGLNFSIENNENAVEYYKQALELKDFINSHSDIKNLRISDAVTIDADGNQASLSEEFGNNNSLIFDELFNGSLTTSIEDEDSNFNGHRLDVIRYSVEKNLSIAVANYNNVSDASYNFRMPELTDYEWDQITDEVTMISFLQGLPIGAKVYSGYSIVTNNKNLEFVSEDSIYILTRESDGSVVYRDIFDNDLYNGVATNYAENTGYYKMNFEAKSGYDSNGKKIYYYPKENVTSSYTSIVNRRNLSDKKISELLNSSSTLAKIYYTALGRERYGMYRPANSTNYSTSLGEDTSQQEISFNVSHTYDDSHSMAYITLSVRPSEMASSVTVTQTAGPVAQRVNTGTEDIEYQCSENGDYTFVGTATNGSTATVTVTIAGIYENNKDFIANEVKVGDYVKYEVPSNSTTVSSSYSGTGAQVISTDSYSSGMWKVFSNENGDLELISDSNVADLEIRGQQGYNNIIRILNQASSIYANPQYADYARGLGTNPTNYTEESNNMVNLWDTSQSSGCKESYYNDRDFGMINAYPSLRTSGSEYTWYASRIYKQDYNQGTNIGQYRFSVAKFTSSGSRTFINVYQIYSNGNVIRPPATSAGIRPVIKLKNNVQILSGSGLMSDPWVLSIGG